MYLVVKMGLSIFDKYFSYVVEYISFGYSF